MAQVKIMYRETRGEWRPGDLDMPVSGIQSYVAPLGHIWCWRDQLEQNIVSVRGLRGIAGVLNLTEPDPDAQNSAA